MNVIDHLAAQHRFGEAWGDIGDLNAAYSRSTDPHERQTLAEQIAALLEQAAGEYEQSGFVRWFSAGIKTDPTELRQRAEYWRLYGDPEGDNR